MDGVSDGATNLHLELSLAHELVLQKLEIEIIGGFDLGFFFFFFALDFVGRGTKGVLVATMY